MPRSKPDPRHAALAAAHRAHQAAVKTVVAAQLAARLQALPDAGDTAAADYVTGAVATITAGQRVAATSAAGFVRAIAPRAGRRPPDLSLGDVVVTAATAWVGSPIGRVRTELSQGASWSEALAAASTYAGSLAAGDLQDAERVGLAAAAEAVDAPVQYWAKVPNGEACQWCLDVADDVYSSPDSVPFHDNDQCGVEPVFR